MRIVKYFSERNREILKNVVGAFAVKGASLMISVLLLPAYLNFFHDQMVLGIWYTILSVLNWMVLFDLGLGNGLRNILPSALIQKDRSRIRSYISTTYFLMGGIALLVEAAGAAVIPHLNWNWIFNVSSDVIPNGELIICTEIVFAGIMLQLVLKIITSILFAMQRAAMVNALGLISNLLVLLCVTLLPSGSLEENLRTMSVVNVVAVNLPLAVMSGVIFCTTLKGMGPAHRYVSPDCVKAIMNIGLSLLWLQLVFMVISSTNELMIANFTAPEYVVQYQAYFKVFKTGAMLVSLALTPIWSAVTKAQAQGDYRWIRRTYQLFLWSCVGCFLMELCLIPFLQVIMDLWLGKGTVRSDSGYAFVFVCSSVMMILHNVNTSIGNGLSYFRLQMVWMTVAAAVCVPLSYAFVQVTGSWIGVVIGTTVALIPYEILAPVFTLKLLRQKIQKNLTESVQPFQI